MHRSSGLHGKKMATSPGPTTRRIPSPKFNNVGDRRTEHRMLSSARGLGLVDGMGVIRCARSRTRPPTARWRGCGGRSRRGRNLLRTLPNGTNRQHEGIEGGLCPYVSRRQVPRKPGGRLTSTSVGQGQPPRSSATESTFRIVDQRAWDALIEILKRLRRQIGSEWRPIRSNHQDDPDQGPSN